MAEGQLALGTFRYFVSLLLTLDLTFDAASAEYVTAWNEGWILE